MIQSLVDICLTETYLSILFYWQISKNSIPRYTKITCNCYKCSEDIIWQISFFLFQHGSSCKITQVGFLFLLYHPTDLCVVTDILLWIADLTFCDIYTIILHFLLISMGSSVKINCCLRLLGNTKYSESQWPSRTKQNKQCACQPYVTDKLVSIHTCKVVASHPHMSSTIGQRETMTKAAMVR